ncbi:hypothetical protein GBF38_015867 [Nibea albiflora]|uniref:Uncharacterized protein n=1 Tax=Nibea albiflora TaxID=240163 RepID=A0ACB7FH31_NIBAL|nr:hypothetical protein GBF38_015867 [Nibea albiflora]
MQDIQENAGSRLAAASHHTSICPSNGKHPQLLTAQHSSLNCCWTELDSSWTSKVVLEPLWTTEVVLDSIGISEVELDSMLGSPRLELDSIGISEVVLDPVWSSEVVLDLVWSSEVVLDLVWISEVELESRWTSEVELDAAWTCRMQLSRLSPWTWRTEASFTCVDNTLRLLGGFSGPTLNQLTTGSLVT